MALEYSTPGVYVEEKSSGFKPITGVPTSIVGFLGESLSAGKNNELFHDPKMITSWEQYVQTFLGYEEKKIERFGKTTIEKEYVKTTQLDWGVYAFFANGGAKCYVVSVGKPNDKTSKSLEETEVETKEKASLNKNQSKKKEESSKSSAASTSSNDWIGANSISTNPKGLKCFDLVDEIALLVAPGMTDSDVQKSILAYCENRQYLFAILDAPQRLEELEKYGLKATLDKQGLASICTEVYEGSKQGAVYFPWVKIEEKINNEKKTFSIAPSGFVAGIYARVDKVRGVHKAPANEVVRLASSLEYIISDEDQALLNTNGINCIRKFSDTGIRVWGARTTATISDPEWKYVNVRRLFNMIEKSLETHTKWAVFEPNDKFLWKKLKRNVDAFLLRVYNSGALVGSNYTEAYRVTCDETLNTQEEIDAGKVIIEVAIAPSKPAEFVVFRISQKEADEEETEGGEE